MIALDGTSPVYFSTSLGRVEHRDISEKGKCHSISENYHADSCHRRDYLFPPLVTHCVDNHQCLQARFVEKVLIANL